MTALRFFVALLAGFLLYEYVVVFLGGILAAVQIPAAYFAFFGREYGALAHAFLSFGLHVAPTVLLVGAGVLAVHRTLPAVGAPTWVPMLLGMVACFLLWLLVLGPLRMERAGHPGQGALAEVMRVLRTPWWAWPSLVAPWLGLALAGWLIRRAAPTPPSDA